MAYEIPQQLQYREKIIFGLDFKQFGYSVIFGVIVLFIFKSNLLLSVKVTLSTFIVVLAVGFMFLDFGRRIKDFLIFMKFKKACYPDKNLVKFLGVKNVKDDVIINEKKKRVAVFKVGTINFGIKSEKEQEVITECFQKFLNSLDFPIQIVMNTESLEVKEYIKSLKGRADNSMKDLLKEYSSFLSETVNNNSIMDRIFYIVVPETTNLEIQIKICEQRLDNLNLEHKRLNTEELTQLLSKHFGGKLGSKVLSEALIPEAIENHPDHFITKTRDKKTYYNRTITAIGYPRMVQPGFLDKIISSLGNFDLSIHLEPFPIETTLININRELQKQRADLYAEQKRGIINPSLEIKYQDTRNILEELQKGKQKLFNVSLYVDCKASTKEELDLLSTRVMSELNSMMIIPSAPLFRQAQGIRSTAPIAINDLNITRNITTSALSAFFPFTSPFFKHDTTGVWLGLNKNKIPIIKDIFKLPNPNGLVLAQSGGGKSYFCKLTISRYLLNGCKVMVIDPQGEYKALVKSFKGQRILLSRTSDTIINPLDLMGHDYGEKRLSLMDLMPILLGELTEPQKSFIDDAITEAYKKKGISEDLESWNNQPPILEDVLTELQSMEEGAIKMEMTTIRSLINRLKLYVTGTFKFLNKHTNINFNNRFVCFDIGELPKQAKPVVMFLVLDYIYMKMRQDLERKILLIDEAWSLLSRTEDASYIFEIVKTCRKFNLGLLLINQEVEGMLNSEAGKSVLANSSYTLLLRQKPAVIDDICKTFHLSNTERTQLLTASVGEGILIMEDDHSEIKVVASKAEHELITTKPDEMLKNKKKSDSEKNTSNKRNKLIPKTQAEQQSEAVKPVVQIKVDEFKGCYKHKDISIHDIKYLLSKGYQQTKLKSITEKKPQLYLIKPRFNESLNHMFLVSDIAEFLTKKGIKVEKSTTQKPDIIFEINKKKFAIEVETGIQYDKDKKRIIEKIINLEKDYDEWFFAVTNKNYVPKYRKLGKTIDPRCLKNHISRILKNNQNLSCKKQVAKTVLSSKKSGKNIKFATLLNTKYKPSGKIRRRPKCKKII